VLARLSLISFCIILVFIYRTTLLIDSASLYFIIKNLPVCNIPRLLLICLIVFYKIPYKDISELPESVKNSLPEHAQDIYKEAYNSAWDEYENKEDRRYDKGREETAHSVAWSAVKKKYHKVDGKWISKDE